MGAPIRFSVDVKSIDPEASSEMSKLRSQIQSIKDRVVRDYRKTDRFKAACDLAGFGDYSSHSVNINCDGVNLSVSTIADVTRIEPTPTKVNISHHNLPESTLNVLLSGKLLTDAEKRKVVSAMTSGIIDAETPQ